MIQEKKLLSREEVLARLRDCWELLDFHRPEMTAEQSLKMQYNLKLADLFSDLQGSKDVSEVSAIGFNYEEYEEEDEDEEEETTGEGGEK